MNFVVRASVSLFKAFVVFYGSQIPALAQDMQCSPVNREISQCVLTEHHPSGPMVTTEWRSIKGVIPFKMEIKGARSGSRVISGTSLLFDADHNWILMRSNGVKVSLLSSSEKPPKVIPRFREAGYLWTIRVTKQDAPIEIVGIATEGEMKLDLEITRIP